MLLTYTLAWLPMIILAIANGTLRELTYGRRIAELRAHQLSTLIAAALFTGYTWLIVRHWPIPSATAAFAIGALWFVLTIAFEFSFGRFVARHPWSRLLQDYKLPAGRVWPLLLLWLFLLPWAVRRLQG